MNNNENLNNVNNLDNNSMANNNVNNQGMGVNPTIPNIPAQEQVPQQNYNEASIPTMSNEVGNVNNAEIPTPAPENIVTNDLMNNQSNNIDMQNNVAPTSQVPNINSDIQSPMNTNQGIQNPVNINPTMQPQENTMNPQNVNIPTQPVMDNVPNQNINNQPTETNNKKSNKNLMIILIVSVAVAVIAIVVAVIALNKNNSSTVNDYENNGDNVVQTTDTMEYDGFTISKKSGYIYEIDEEAEALVISNNSSAFQIRFLPYSFSSIEASKEAFKTDLSLFGYNPTNMKVDEYAGNKVLSYELEYEGIKILYYIYSISSGNYCVEVYGLKRDGLVDYNLITEAIDLTKDVTKSSTFANETTETEMKTSKMSSNFLTNEK